MPWLALAGAAVIVLALPDSAWAWGPVTHLSHGAEVLRDLSNLPEALQRLLLGQRWEYLYGTIAADIVQVKRYTRSIYTHCHSWRVGALRDWPETNMTVRYEICSTTMRRLLSNCRRDGH